MANESWIGQVLDSKEKIDAYRSVFQNEIYQKACTYLEAEDQALTVTNQVLDEAVKRFSVSPISSDPVPYLLGKVLLKSRHLTQNAAAVQTPPTARVVSAENSNTSQVTDYANETRPIPEKKRATQQIKVHRRIRPAMQSPSCAVGEKPVIHRRQNPVVQQPTVKTEEQATEKTITAAPAAAEKETEASVAHTNRNEEWEKMKLQQRREAVYENSATALWLPGDNAVTGKEDVNATDRNIDNDDDDEPIERRSVRLSFFNSVLVIVLIASGLFTLYQSGVLDLLLR